MARPKGVKELTKRKPREAKKSLSLIGTKIGRWTVLGINQQDGHRVKFKVKCDCGTEGERHYETIAYGKSQSCGCYHNELLSTTQRKHDSAFNKVYCSYRQSAKNRNIEFNLTKEQFSSLINKPCFYCGKEKSLSKETIGSFLEYNGVDRVDNSICYIIDNCVPCCKVCNNQKSNVTKEIIFKAAEFLRNKNV